jgi:hypothetical protein
MVLKCVTKAKRRVTLSICGLGWLDETEVETIPVAKIGPDVISGAPSPQEAPDAAPSSSGPPAGGGTPRKKRDKKAITEESAILTEQPTSGLDIIGMAWKAAEQGTEFFNQSFIDMRSIEEKRELAAYFTKGSEHRARLRLIMDTADKEQKEGTHEPTYE